MLEIVDVFSYVLLNSLFWSARDNNEIRVKNDGKVQELEENFFQDLEAWMEIMIQLIVNAEWTHYEIGLLRLLPFLKAFFLSAYLQKHSSGKPLFKQPITA